MAEIRAPGGFKIIQDSDALGGLSLARYARSR